MTTNYFPLGIAEGEAFLGREEECARLRNNIKYARHTLLLSPRRYGKTSLARHVIKKSSYAYVEIDLFLAIDERSIETRFLDGIQKLIQELSDKLEQWTSVLINFFKRSDKKWTVGFKGLKLEIKPDNHDDIADNLLSALNAVELILSKKKQHAVIFVDEFQEIARLDKARTLEGAIRHFAQGSKYLVFAFSGSNRHLLIDIFGNRSRPLYELCDWVTIERLDPNLYHKYIEKVANKTWGKEISLEVRRAITDLTECHPEATYSFCAHIWNKCQKNPPKIKDIDKLWRQHIRDKHKQTRLILSDASRGQLRILILIAQGYTSGLSGKEAQQKLNLAGSTITDSLNTLVSDDLIERQPDGSYRVLNPILKATLVLYYENYFS